MIDFIWVAGLPASGKSTFISFLQPLLKKTGRVSVMGDFWVYRKLIEKDIAQQYHQKFGKDVFLITDSFIPNQAIKQTTAKALQIKGLKLIEIGRGQDIQGKVDLTFKGMVSLLPASVLARSVFIYLRVPFDLRNQRNEKRAIGQKIAKRKVNPAAMARLFRKDDFRASRKLLPQPVFVVDNSLGLLRLRFQAWQLAKKIKKLTDPKLCQNFIDQELLRYVIDKARETEVSFPCWDVYALLLGKERVILGEAAREVSVNQRAVLKHAERVLLEKMGKNNLRGSTLYTSLEPCVYSNQEQGCAFLVRKTGIKRVVIGSPDFSPVNSHRSVRILQEAGIQVIFGHQISERLGLKARLISPEDWLLNTISTFKEGKTDHWSQARKDKYLKIFWLRALLFNFYVFLIGRLPFWERKTISERQGAGS